ncbi:ribosomal protein L7/L12 C-terminal domain-containing protein [Trametes punicea]|nr:ribosomal protein L7/L12 C-terminal domain-containing protein [Trametes punicea]
MTTRCSPALRSFSRSCRATRPRVFASSLRYASTEAAVASSSSPSAPPLSTDPKISKIVDDISGLTLLQAADLVALLKSRLNIQEIAMPASAPAAAPAAAAEETEAEKPKEKTVFNVKLESFDAAAKPKIIREVKAIVPNLTLIEAKKFVESLPKVVKEGLSKEDAEKLKKTFTDLGATVALE